mmetsp:Transcript_36556/g.95692  ORF Transcript_36556/g.95692 Transcript_36556/m.95692 type:complete len:254 (-) Transcript_36556:26-787(-)
MKKVVAPTSETAKGLARRFTKPFNIASALASSGTWPRTTVCELYSRSLGCTHSSKQRSPTSVRPTLRRPLPCCLVWHPSCRGAKIRRTSRFPTRRNLGSSSRTSRASATSVMCEPETGAPTPHATLWRGRATFGSLGRGTGRVVCATSSQSWPINGALAAAARSATTGPVWRLALHHPRGSHRPGCHLATSVVHPRRLRSRVSRCVWVKAGVSFARGSRSWSPREVHGWPSELAAPRPKPTSPVSHHPPTRGF